MGLEPGATNTLAIVVGESMTADRFGNTGVQVLATPMLVSYFELAAHQLAMPALEPGQGTVGSHIDIRHLAATPIGMRSPSGRPSPNAMGVDWSSGSRPTTTTSVSVAPTSASSSTCRGSWGASPPKGADPRSPGTLAPALLKGRFGHGVGRQRPERNGIRDVAGGSGTWSLPDPGLTREQRLRRRRVQGLDGEKVAAYQDDDGRLHAVSGRCTHLGCLVAWNTAERTWDCPCHGSRYTCEGKVIQGPAVDDLAPRHIEEA
jgi:nitrite reductase/ring-hydroxylating ferredoxin subunit